MHRTIAIVGGGITGLTAAFRAQIAFPGSRIVLLESSDHLGGVLQSESVGGYLIEHSADMFTSDPPAAIELCQQLGKSDELIETKPTSDRAFVATNDSIHPVPRGLSLMLPNDLESVMSSPLLDQAAKQRFADERNVQASDWETDESLESFASRRFGRSAFERLIQPLVGGIYTADPRKLSMLATMSRFVALEKEHGSLIRAAQSSKNQPAESEASGARYGLFRAPAKGMGQLVEWLQDALVNVEVRTGSHVKSVSNTDDQWRIETESSSTNESLVADGLVLATAASVTGPLLRSMNERLGKQLATIEGASSAIVVLGIDETQMANTFSGYGIIVPSILNRQVIATSFASNKFEGRAPIGKMLVRCFIGGALQAELVDLDDQQLIEIATQELAKTVGFDGEPDLTRVFRWKNCMPQYHLGHLDRVKEIESLVRRLAGLEIAGNSYRGVGIPACIESGSAAIERLVKYFADG